jgi:recombination protein RecA
MQRINKKSPGAVILGSEIVPPLRATITSGSLNLDAALGGGWATGHWIEIIGHESTGKTYLVLKTIAANQRRDKDWTVVWFATEDFNEEYARMLGVDVDRIIIENENLMEVVYQHAKEFLDTKAVDCIVIDSLPFLVPAREDDATMEDFQPGLAAFLTGKFFRKSQSAIKRNLTTADERPCTGFVINQWREKIGGYGDPRISPGGKAKNFVFYQRIDISRDEWITNTRGEPVGQVMKLKNIKNKFARPGLIGYVDAYVAEYRGHKAGSFDLVKDAISAGLAYEVIRRPDKLHYEFAGQSWAGRPKMEAAIKADRGIRRQLRKEVLAAAVDPIEIEEPAPVKKAVKKRAPHAKR